MAHVLLPCDLPYWPDVQRLLSQLQLSGQDGLEVVRTMDLILDACCVSLDPDDSQRAPRPGPHPGLCQLGHFLEEVLCAEERTRLLEDTLPVLASRASDLKRLKPPEGMLYSLRKEGGCCRLHRGFVSSLLANAFFSTFPKRNAKTHPTLQDFRMVHFFTHLNRRSHQKKLRAFLHYFEDGRSPDGEVVFTRKVVSGPSLPGWLCSDRPLVPLVVRPEGSLVHPTDNMYRACFCPPLIGGDVLKESTSKECVLFFAFPELLVLLSFVESLEDDEAFTVEGTQVQGGPAGFCFLDAGVSEGGASGGGQFEDRALLRELNKALAAFRIEPMQQHTMEESRKGPPPEERPRRGSGSGRRKNPSLSHHKKSLSQTSSKSSMRTASQSSVPGTEGGREEDYFTADDDSDEGSLSRLSDSLPRTEEASVSRSDSLGFVLGEGEGEEEGDPSLPQHERLDDFRKRIRKRTRRRVSRRSSSYAGSSGGSSDMEDISEDPEPPEGAPRGMRPANSEPTIASMQHYDGCAPLSAAAEIALRGGVRRMMVTASNGHLKAYSYDGVSPNLPVPFRARFRKRRPMSPSTSSMDDNSTCAPPSNTDEDDVSCRRRCVAVDGSECPGDSQLSVTVLWLAASVAELPALVLYTEGQAALREVCSVYRQVLSRDWSVGDLSCEVLRFCRNRLYPRGSRRSHSTLFGQLIGNAPDSLDLD